MSISSISNRSNLKRPQQAEAGFSMLEVVITFAIICVVVSFGVMGVRRAQDDMALAGAMRQFAAYMEKGRVEAVRRHTTVGVVTINNASSYTVALDSNYDGTTIAGETRSITLPTGMTFNASNITFPATISYDSRGRSSSTNINGSTLTMTNSYGHTTSLTMTGGGDLTLDSAVTGPAASTNLNPRTTVSNTANTKPLY